MKLLLKSMVVLLISVFLVSKCEAMNFAEGYEQSGRKPMILLIYADWAGDYKSYIKVLDSLEKVYEDKFNFVKLDIAKPEAAAFNARYHIYPNLPYILMFRNQGKISRYIQGNCAIDYSCVESKMKTFIQ